MFSWQQYRLDRESALFNVSNATVCGVVARNIQSKVEMLYSLDSA